MYHEVRKSDQIITTVRYWEKLVNLCQALKDIHPEFANMHDKVIYQRDNAGSHCQTGQRTVKTTWIGYVTTLQFTEHYYIGLSFVSIDVAWPFQTAFQFIWRHKNIIVVGLF